MASQFTIPSGGLGQVIDCGSNGSLIKNVGPGTVYYRDESPVTSTQNDGSIASGSSSTLYGAVYVNVTTAATVEVFPVAVVAAAGGGPARVVQGGSLGATYTLATDGDEEVWLVGTLTANCTISITGLVDGAHVKLVLTQDATGGRTLSVSDDTTTASVTIPTTASTAFGVDVYHVGSDTYVESPGAATGGGGGGGGGGTAPAVLDDATIWLKADDITGLTDGAAVASWADSSGNSNNATQGTSGSRPVYKASILNSKPAVRFDGVDDSLSITPSPALGTPQTIFAVFKSPGFGTVWSGTSDPTSYLGRATPNPTNVRFVAGYENLNATATPVNGVVTTVVQSPTTPVFRVNGTGGTVNELDLPLNAMTLGIRIYSQDPGEVDICEVIVVSGVMLLSDIQAVEAYLGTKYDIAVA